MKMFRRSLWENRFHFYSAPYLLFYFCSVALCRRLRNTFLEQLIQKLFEVLNSNTSVWVFSSTIMCSSINGVLRQADINMACRSGQNTRETYYWKYSLCFTKSEGDVISAQLSSNLFEVHRVTYQIEENWILRGYIVGVFSNTKTLLIYDAVKA